MDGDAHVPYFRLHMKQIKICDGTLGYEDSFYTSNEGYNLLEALKKSLILQQNDIKIFGKNYKTPRLEGFYSKEGQQYGYSGKKLKALAFTPLLNEICKKIEVLSKHEFNSVLINLYRDGNDSNGWHSDDEKELGSYPFIASLSLGEQREIQFKHKTNGDRIKQNLEHGSLLVMGGAIQKHWKHQIPKTKLQKTERMNLTFRNIID